MGKLIGRPPGSPQRWMGLAEVPWSGCDTRHRAIERGRRNSGVAGRPGARRSRDGPGTGIPRPNRVPGRPREPVLPPSRGPFGPDSRSGSGARIRNPRRGLPRGGPLPWPPWEGGCCRRWAGRGPRPCAGFSVCCAPCSGSASTAPRACGGWWSSASARRSPCAASPIGRPSSPTRSRPAGSAPSASGRRLPGSSSSSASTAVARSTSSPRRCPSARSTASTASRACRKAAASGRATSRAGPSTWAASCPLCARTSSSTRAGSRRRCPPSWPNTPTSPRAWSTSTPTSTPRPTRSCAPSSPASSPAP